MKLEAVKNAVTSKAGRQILLSKKHSPTILFAAGIVGITGTVVLACRATLKLEEVLDESDQAHQDIDLLEKSTRKEVKRDHAYVYVRTAVNVGRLYAPSVALGVVSITALTGSHVVLSRRNVALTAAYKTLEEGFNKYRQRVIDDQGEEKDLEYRRDIKVLDVHDTEKGKVVKRRVQGDGKSEYAVYFDENNQNWKPFSEYNLFFLRASQQYANQRLNARGHLFLNEVYDALGMDHTKAGAVVGWIKNSGGDNFVDFGIFDSHAMDRFYDFVVGNEGVWLDFNVDGVIYDKI